LVCQFRRRTMTPETWEDTTHNPTFQDVEVMKRETREVCLYSLAILAGDLEEAKKHRRLAMFCSKAGLSKSYTINRVC
jgi:hypothetical protein